MLAPIRFLARVLLGLTFIVLGWDAAQQPGGRVDKAADLGIPEPELAVVANGYTMAGAGAALVLGIFPRLAALVLAVSLVPTTLAGHPFWEEENPQQRAGQRIHFLKNLSMIGGLLFVAVGSGNAQRAARD